MTIEIELSKDGGNTWSTVNYRDFEITNPIGFNEFCPKAKIWTDRNAQIKLEDLVRIKIDGDTRFKGLSKSNGKFNTQGVKMYEIRGHGYEILDENVSVSLTNTSPENVLQKILPTDFSLQTPTSTGVSIPKYEVNDKRKKVFRDMMDRTQRVLLFKPDKTIVFEELGRTKYSNIDTGKDKSGIIEYEEGQIDTVVNKVEVVGTFDGEKFTGTAEDFTKVSQVKEKQYNFRYVSSNSEAQDLANELLQPEPTKSGRIRVGGQKYTPKHVSNQKINLTDEPRYINDQDFVVEKQIIKPQHMDLIIGTGQGTGFSESNRIRLSNEDKTEPGSTYGAEAGKNLTDSDGEIIEQTGASGSFQILEEVVDEGDGDDITGSEPYPITHTNNNNYAQFIHIYYSLSSYDSQLPQEEYIIDLSNYPGDSTNGSTIDSSIVSVEILVPRWPPGAETGDYYDQCSSQIIIPPGETVEISTNIIQGLPSSVAERIFSATIFDLD